MVKEVERLKKNREERRAKQQEMLEVKEKAIEMNANHANYDFFCMIQDYQEQLEFNHLTEEDAISDHQVGSARPATAINPNRSRWFCGALYLYLFATSTGHSRASRTGSQYLAALGAPCGACAPPRGLCSGPPPTRWRPPAPATG